MICLLVCIINTMTVKSLLTIFIFYPIQAQNIQSSLEFNFSNNINKIVINKECLTHGYFATQDYVECINDMIKTIGGVVF